ncbi:MAG: type 4a pilus biogenesis protein PilO [Polyangiales bacterium]
MAAAKKGGINVGSLSPNALVVIGWFVALVGVLAAYYFLFYDPLTQEEAAQQTRRTELAASRVREQENLRRYNTDVAELARARQRAQSLESVLPNDPDIPGFMRSINALAEASGLQIQLIQPTDERVERYYARIPVQLHVRGGYLSLARFFHSVSQLPRVINMENISLREPTRDPGTGEWKVNAEVLATTFRGVAGGTNDRPAGQNANATRAAAQGRP